MPNPKISLKISGLLPFRLLYVTHLSSVCHRIVIKKR